MLVPKPSGRAPSASPDDFAVGFAPLCAYVKRLLLAFALYFRLHQVKCLMNLLNAFSFFLIRQGYAFGFA